MNLRAGIRNDFLMDGKRIESISIWSDTRLQWLWRIEHPVRNPRSGSYYEFIPPMYSFNYGVIPDGYAQKVPEIEKPAALREGERILILINSCILPRQPPPRESAGEFVYSKGRFEPDQNGSR